jgi:TolB-like protein/Flp pilus assembly protein TadD
MQVSSWLQEFYRELKRRRIFRVITLYVVAFWPIIQIADILSPALDLPDSAMRLLLLTFITGFPIVLILAWIFNLDTSGITKTQSNGSAEGEALLGSNAELWIVGALLLIVAILFFVQSNTERFGWQATQSNTVPSPPGKPDSSPDNSIKSIAVLPFAIFSKNSDDEYFADGLTEELLNVLSRCKSLRVAARTSSFAYKGISKNITEIGRELNVDNILEGSVRRNDVDNTIRVTAQLIDVNTGAHRWSQTFDRRFEDIFKIQDEISSSVVSQLEVQLLGNEYQGMRSRGSANPEAMIAYAMGRSELAKRTRVALEDAIRFFEKAVDLDPSYAASYAGLADSYTLVSIHVPGDMADYLASAQDAVDRGLALDPDLGALWASQGLIRMQQNREEEAIQALQTAMQLNPSYAMAYMWSGILEQDRSKRSEYFRQAFELDPRSAVAGFNVANDLVESGRDIEAMEIFSRIVEVDPYYPGAYRLVGIITEYRGRLDEAVVQYKKAYELEASSQTAAQLARLYTNLSDFDNADRWLQAASKDAPDKQSAQLTWLSIRTLLARGQGQQAEPLLRSMLNPVTQDRRSYLHASWAAYLLSDFAATIEFYEKALLLPVANSMDDLKRELIDSHIGAAYAYQQIGRAGKAAEVLSQSLERVNAIVEDQVRFEPEMYYRRAMMFAIQGENRTALAHIQRAIDEGWREHWRPMIEPSLQSVIADEDFKSMMAGLQARMSLLREQLALEESMNDNWQG